MSETKCPMPDDVCEQCGYRCAPQPSAPSGEAVAIVASEIGDAIAAHDAGENVNAVDRAKHVVAALLPEMNDYWHNGYAKGKRDASLLAAPPQDRVSEAMVEAGLKAKDGYAVFGAVYGVGEREVMRRILTAAMSAGRADV